MNARGCRKSRPHWSRGMLVFVDEPAESVASADGEARDLGRFRDRVWQWAQGPGVRDSPRWTTRVVMPLVLAQGVYEMELAPHQHPVEQLLAAALERYSN